MPAMQVVSSQRWWWESSRNDVSRSMASKSCSMGTRLARGALGRSARPAFSPWSFNSPCSRLEARCRHRGEIHQCKGQQRPFRFSGSGRRSLAPLRCRMPAAGVACQTFLAAEGRAPFRPGDGRSAPSTPNTSVMPCGFNSVNHNRGFRSCFSLNQQGVCASIRCFGGLWVFSGLFTVQVQHGGGGFLTIRTDV